jgi:hypothetical protein
MLFFEEVNSIGEKSKFTQKVIKDCDNSNNSKASKKKSKFKKRQIRTNRKSSSLGLQNEEIDYSDEGYDDDLCLCEVEPMSGYFGANK